MHANHQPCNHCFILHYSTLLLLTLCFYLNTRMESLLCNEVWLMSPNVQENDHGLVASSVCTNNDFEEAFANFLGKEIMCLPESGYVKLLATDDLIANSRFKAVTWIIKSYTRMDLCPETVFAAVNYLDRFILLSRCKEWNGWMFEILSLSCLSIATKFYETTVYALHEFKDDLENSFAPSLIQRMELTVLKVLDWRVNQTTAFSYIHLLTQTIHGFNKTLVYDLTKRVARLLIDALLDPNFLGFQQYVLAISAFKIVLQDSFPSTQHYASVSHLDTLVPQDDKDDLIHSQRMMEKLMARECRNSCSSPSSPLTIDLFNWFDPSLKTTGTNINMRWSRKRKGGELD